MGITGQVFQPASFSSQSPNAVVKEPSSLSEPCSISPLAISPSLPARKSGSPCQALLNLSSVTIQGIYKNFQLSFPLAQILAASRQQKCESFRFPEPMIIFIILIIIKINTNGTPRDNITNNELTQAFTMYVTRERLLKCHYLTMKQTQKNI